MARSKRSVKMAAMERRRRLGKRKAEPEHVGAQPTMAIEEVSAGAARKVIAAMRGIEVPRTMVPTRPQVADRSHNISVNSRLDYLQCTVLRTRRPMSEALASCVASLLDSAVTKERHAVQAFPVGSLPVMRELMEMYERIDDSPNKYVQARFDVLKGSAATAVAPSRYETRMFAGDGVFRLTMPTALSAQR